MNGQALRVYQYFVGNPGVFPGGMSGNLPRLSLAKGAGEGGKGNRVKRCTRRTHLKAQVIPAVKLVGSLQVNSGERRSRKQDHNTHITESSNRKKCHGVKQAIKEGGTSEALLWLIFGSWLFIRVN